MFAVNNPKDKAPAFILPDLKGELHQLDEYKGKVLVVNFWATWCAPCREEIPAMNRANAILAGQNVQMLAINYGEDAATVTEFLAHTPIEFTVLLDTQNTVSKAWQIIAMPTTLLIDTAGDIQQRILGPREWDSPEMIDAIKAIANSDQ